MVTNSIAIVCTASCSSSDIVIFHVFPVMQMQLFTFVFPGMQMLVPKALPQQILRIWRRELHPAAAMAPTEIALVIVLLVASSVC